MNIFEKLILKYFNYFWSRRRTKYGLLAFLCLVIYALSKSLPRFELSFLIEILIYIIIISIIYIIWLFHSGRRKIKSKKISIAFSLKSLNPEAQLIISQMISMLSDHLNHLRIRNHFKFHNIATDIFTSVDEAEKFIEKRKYNIIIHGSIYGGKDKTAYKYQLNNPMFTYLIYNIPLNPALKNLMKADIDLFSINRDWIIEESNNLVDTQKISHSLLEIILAIISFCLARSREHIEIAIKLIEALLPELEKRAQIDDKKIIINPDEKKMSIPIELLRTGRLRNILCNVYITFSRVLMDEDEIDSSIDYAERGLQAGADPMEAYATLAIAYFYKGDQSKSEKYVNKMGEIDTNNQLYLIDKAFYCIVNKEYSDATKFYVEFLQSDGDKEEVSYQVLFFLSERLRENPNEAGYKFGLGFINYHFGDREKGIKYFKKFKKLVKGMKIYKDMVKYIDELPENNKPNNQST